MSAVPATLPRVRSRVLAPRIILGAIVLVGTAVLWLLTRTVITPSVFPDEYLYAQLGRGLATTGHLNVLGVDVHFLPMLQPILTAPMWLIHDVGLAHRMIQLENAFVFSLTALPAYALARRLGVRTGLALGIAALVICGPPALFNGMVMAESFGYLLSVLVLLAATRAIAAPSLRAQIVLLVVSGLAAFDRLQLAALPLSAVVAVLFVALRERRVRATLREQWLLMGVFGFTVAAGLGYTLVRGLGYYHLRPRPVGFASSLGFAGLHGYVVLLAIGMAVAPAALVGLAQALARPRERAEAAFGAFTLSIAVLVITQCVLWGDVHRVQERYLGYLLPPVALAYGLRCMRANRRPLGEIGVAAGVALVAVLVPLDGYAIDAKHHLAPTLYAFTTLAGQLGSQVETAAVFALGATVLAALGAIVAALRLPPLIPVVASMAASFAILVLGLSWSGALAHDARANYLPADMHWVDHAVHGKASMLVVGNAWNGQALGTILWNPSVARVVRMPGSNRVDWLDDPFVHVRADGVVTLGGRPLNGDVLVQASPASAVTMRAQPVGSFGDATLWRPRSGPARLASVMNNRLKDGRVLKSGGMEVWSPTGRLAGWIELQVYAPKTIGNAHLALVRTGVDVPAGQSRVVRVRACGSSPWSGGFVASPVEVQGNQWTSPLVSQPRYVPDPAACG